MIIKRIILTAVLGLVTQLAFASDRYIVQGQAFGPMVSASDRLTWFSDAVLLNRGATDAVVTVRKISNGGKTDGLRTTVVIPSGRSATLQGLRAWGTAPNAPLWVVQVDAPDSVDIEGLLRIGTVDAVTLASPTGRPDRFGRAQLPVFRAFVPAGERQAHLSTDLGNDLGNDVASHVNVGIYNPSAVTASATIEFRQHCDDTLLASTSITVPPDTLIQVPGLGGTSHNCPSNDPSFLGGGGIYAVVTVDQQSVSFVSVLANSLTPSNSISIRQ
ncbi:MAG: hypothetical protein QOC81_164 [Thermoanaerobaculia bacterium]|nr:hypothetical protein [Thermoanaerobaculia bacterium]